MLCNKKKLYFQDIIFFPLCKKQIKWTLSLVTIAFFVSLSFIILVLEAGLGFEIWNYPKISNTFFGWPTMAVFPLTTSFLEDLYRLSVETWIHTLRDCLAATQTWKLFNFDGAIYLKSSWSAFHQDHFWQCCY